MTTVRRRLAALLLLAAGACSGGEAGDREVATPANDDLAAFWAAFRGAGESRLRGARAGALEGYEDALRLRPEHGDALYYVAQLRYERGEVAVARQRLLQLAAVEPRGLRAWQQRSVLDGTPLPGWSPDLTSATESASMALQLSPSESRNSYLAARWAAYAGDFAAAEERLDAAVGHNPLLWSAHLLRVWIAARRGDAARALRLRDELRARACGEDGARCAPHDPLHDILLAAAQPDADGIDVAALAARRGRDLDIDGDGRIDTRLLLGGDDDVLVLPAARGNQPPGPQAVPVDGAVLHGPGQPSLLLVTGDAVRAYALAAGAYGPIEHSIGELGAGLTLPVVSAGDIDGDGLDEVLLANLPQADGALLGVLYRGTPDGRFEPMETFPGPLSAAHMADLDGDGDTDLLLARDARLDLFAGSVLERALGSDPPAAPPAAILSLWRNDDGKLAASAAPLPELWSPVNSIASFDADGDGRLDVILATGGLAPEKPAPDRLWLQEEGRFMDASARLGDAAHGATWRAWPDGDGAVVLARGGLLPGDALHLARLRVR